MKRRTIFRIIGATVLGGRLPISHSSEPYPSKPITVIVPYAAGGALSVFGQRLSLQMEPLLGVNVLIDSRGGAGGIIGTTAVARSRADGYTLLLAATGSHIISPLTQANPPFDPLKDFEPIALLTRQPMVLAVHPQLGVGSLPELVELLRKSPGKYSYASAGTGALGHLTGELFLRAAGNVKAVHVPYKGGGPAIADVIAGHVAFTWEVMSSVLPHHLAGRLRIISVGSESRAALLPEVPTAIEAGLSEFVSETQQFLLAPAGTPTDAISKLSMAVKGAMGAEDFLKELRLRGVNPVTDSTPSAAAAVIRRELDRWRPVVQALSLR